MKIEKATHKVLLHSLFHDVIGSDAEGTPIARPKTFNIDKLADAAAAIKKLLENSRIEDSRIYFADGEIEFTVGESSVLKGLFDACKEWETTSADAVFEVRELLR